MKKLKTIWANLLNKRFNNVLDEAVKRANKLHKDKSSTVICVYCGQLLLKSEAAVVYDISQHQMEYSHEACFDKNETVRDSFPELAQEGDKQDG